jgi:hypothetical protein
VNLLRTQTILVSPPVATPIEEAIEPTESDVIQHSHSRHSNAKSFVSHYNNLIFELIFLE